MAWRFTGAAGEGVHDFPSLPKRMGHYCQLSYNFVASNAQADIG